jgi:predicted transcriptional regulator
MSEQRITLNLDDDVVEALRAVGGGSISAVANDALRDALERRAHQAAVLEWLHELYHDHGAPSAEDYAEADAFLDSAQRGDHSESGAA